MEAFRRFAMFTVARDAGFVVLAAVTLMIGFSYTPAYALMAGASIALFFSVGLLLRAGRLDERRIVRTEAWKILRPEERPTGDAGRRRACADLEQVLFRYAYVAAGIAITLYAFSMLASLDTGMQPAHTLVSATVG
jgi:hypothetical protein